MLSNVYFAFFCIPIVIPLCAYLGLNLNYMMIPPPTSGNMISGVNYQLISYTTISAIFDIIRLIETITKFIIRHWGSLSF